jgi:hypothetical protein
LWRVFLSLEITVWVTFKLAAVYVVEKGKPLATPVP